MTNPSPARGQVCVFRLDGVAYAIPVLDVLEVVRTTALVPVPGAPTRVVGMHNLRGRIIACVDTRILLDRPSEAAAGSIAMVVQVGPGRVGLLVEEIEGVVSVADPGIRELTATRPPHRAISRILQASGELIPVLDVAELHPELGEETEASCPTSAS